MTAESGSVEEPVQDPGSDRSVRTSRSGESGRSGRSGSSRGVEIAEVLLGLALVLAPLAVGAVRLWSIGLVAGLCVAAAIAAATAGHPRRVPWPVWAASAAAIYTGLQAVPLPAPLLRLASPRAAELLDLLEGGHFTGAHAIALDPAATLRELARLTALACALFAASRVASRDRGRKQLVRLMAAACLVECVVVLLHKFTGATHIYGLFYARGPVVLLGTFASVNHFAAFLTLGMGATASLALVTEEEGQRRAWWAATGLAFAMIVAVLSRSGILGACAFAAALLVCAAPILHLGARSIALRIVAGAAVAAAAVGLAVFLDPRRGARLAVLFQPEALLAEEKVAVWRDLPALFADFARAGIGRGNFEQVFPAYRHHADTMTFSHVECAPLQALADLGLLAGGAVVLAWVAGLVVAGMRTRDRHDALGAGLLAGLAGVTIHDLGDFSLDASAAVGLHAAVAWAVLFPAGAPVASRAAATARRLVPTALALPLVALALLLALRGDLGRDVARVRAAKAAKPPQDLGALLAETSARHPSEPWFAYSAGVEHLRRREPGPALRDLNRALLLEPSSWRTHQAIAEALLLGGRRAQALLEARLAYVSSDYQPDTLAILAGMRGLLDGPLEAFVGGDLEVLRRVAAHFDRLGRDDEAEWLARRLVERAPEATDGGRLLARVLLRRKRFAEALVEAERLPPKDPERVLLRMQALDGLGRTAEADALLRDPALAAAPAEIAVAAAERALARQRPEDVIAGLARFRNADLPDVLVGRYYRARAAALEQQGKIRDSLLDLGTLVRLEPSETNRLVLGAAFERAGMVRQAYLVYRDLVRSTQNPSPEAQRRLAETGARFAAPTTSGNGGLPAPGGFSTSTDKGDEGGEGGGGEGGGGEGGE